MEEPIFYAEYRRQLKAAQVSIRLPNHQRSSAIKNGEHRGKYSIEIRPEYIQLTVGDLHCTWKYILPSGMRALPGTCSGLELVQNDGIQMRVQIETQEEDEERRAEGSEEEDEAASTEDGATSPEDKENEEPIFKALNSPGCEIVCGRCDAVLLPAGGVNKVLPLPSGDWSDLAGDMWCCKSKVIAVERGRMSPLQLTPSEGSVLVDDLHLVINSSMLAKGSVNVERMKDVQPQPSHCRTAKCLSVICQRCLCFIGSVDNQGGGTRLETTKLYRYAVRVSQRLQMLDGVTWRNPLEDTITSLMVALFKSQMTFKYIVEDVEGHQPQLLIWLLSTDTRLLRTDMDTGICSQSLPGRSGSSPEMVQPTTSHPKDSQFSVELKSRRTLKVLYQTCESEASRRLAGEWNRDLMVHGITLTKDACLELGLLLATSTLIAPHSMRQMNGYKVGALNLDQR